MQLRTGFDWSFALVPYYKLVHSFFFDLISKCLQKERAARLLALLVVYSMVLFSIATSLPSVSPNMPRADRIQVSPCL